MENINDLCPQCGEVTWCNQFAWVYSIHEIGKAILSLCCIIHLLTNDFDQRGFLRITVGSVVELKAVRRGCFASARARVMLLISICRDRVNRIQFLCFNIIGYEHCFAD